MIDRAEVIRALEAEGLNVRAMGKRIVGASFDVEGIKQEVLVFESATGYFVAVSPIDSPQLTSKPSGLTQQVLATLLEVGASVALAKVDFQLLEGDELLYTAMSYCSVEGWTGAKLLRRMREVAVLAVRIVSALSRPAAAPAAAR